MQILSTFLGKALSSVKANLRQFFTNPYAFATGLTFAFDSLMFGSWVTHIPHVKAELGLNDAELGIALFGMPLGLLAMNPFSPMLLHRFGLSRTTIWSTVLMAISFAVPLWMPEKWSLMGALFLVGVAVALMNVAMNTCATNIEKAQKIYIMSSCHGMWSMGGMVGAGISAMLITAGLAPHVHLTGLAFLLLLAVYFYLAPIIAGIPDEKSAEEVPPKISFPNRDLFLMIFIGSCTSFGEGIAFDWSAVYLHSDLGASPQVAALGFTCFSLSMMSMRFIGDALIPRFGEKKLLYFSLFTTIFALIIIILATGPLLGIVGYLLLGGGVALSAPILFNASARVDGYAQGAGLATYATFSFLGFLVGPPLIGFVGESYGLAWGFGMVTVLMVIALPAIRAVRL